MTKIFLLNLSIFKICHYCFQPYRTRTSLWNPVVCHSDGCHLCQRPCAGSQAVAKGGHLHARPLERYRVAASTTCAILARGHLCVRL
ncbi:hypothetical protein AXF42_Ash017794 [Apostasia shenzhenica]|uniref:Uncharacterized protein n=1 Tax=Apostasia shenzhenica TaxID=1088818 RepID=A0A2I0A3S6_9ASPA|nr:hypothetical protein AXF42_Ash017794 [Apostasia shenzhenica]